MNFTEMLEILIKQKGTKAVFSILGGYAFSLFLPIAKFVLLIFVLVIFDMFTGLYGAYTQNEVISSRKLSRTITKFISYTIAVVLSHLMTKIFFENILFLSIPLTYIVAFFICLVEFQSNIENIDKITGINLWGKLKIYLKFIHNIKNKT